MQTVYSVSYLKIYDFDACKHRKNLQMTQILCDKSPEIFNNLLVGLVTIVNQSSSDIFFALYLNF